VNKARRTLANSYVFAYYGFEDGSPLCVGGDGRQVLFEDKQQRLEAEVETLCKMLQVRDAAKPSTANGATAASSDATGAPDRPSEGDVRRQRRLVIHWMEALYQTMDKHILEEDAYGISIPEFDLSSM
jgi:hypothetical protein